MWLYLIIFSIPFFAYITGKPVNRSKKFLLFYTSFLALFVGLSDMFGGYDRYIYGSVFDSIADGITSGNQVFLSSSFLMFETGFSVLTYLIACLTENRYIYIMILTLIIYYNLYKTFERHFDNYPLAFILFLGLIFFFTFTYLRQVVAFSTAWLGIKYLIEDKKKHFIFILIIVALLHKSGIVFSVLLFIPIKKWSPNLVIVILLLCGVIGLSGITSSLYDVVMASGMVAKQGNDYNADGGARLAYILEVVFFAWFILSNYNKLKDSRENLVFLNMTWAFCIFLLLFVRSSDGGRVAWYFTIGIVYIIQKISITNNYNVLTYAKNELGALMIVVMLLLYVRVYYSWAPYNMLYPYKTFLTDGRRNPDWILEHYEYDYRYVNDKFYRPTFRFLKD